MNHITIKGRLTRDPETKTTDSGKTLCNFTVAVSRRFRKDTTDFFNVTAWEKTGEFVQKYFKKGQEILLSGEMQSRKYDDKDGNKRTAWDIRVEQIEFCGSKSDNGGQTFDEPMEMVDDGEIPF